MPNEETVSAGMAAKVLGISRRTVSRWMAEGKLERAADPEPGKPAQIKKSSLTAASRQLRSQAQNSALTNEAFAETLLQHLFVSQEELGKVRQQLRQLSERTASTESSAANKIERLSRELAASKSKERLVDDLRHASLLDFWRWRRSGEA